MSVSIPLPPPMLTEMERLAEREGKTVPELLEEAVRHYLIQTELRELQTYGRQQSQKLGLTEKDVERLVHDYRRERRERPST